MLLLLLLQLLLLLLLLELQPGSLTILTGTR
jgi:hypothetical protein